MNLDLAGEPPGTPEITITSSGHAGPALGHMPFPAPAAAGCLLQAALALAGQGWYIFPCLPSTKRPAVPGWERRATTDPDRITRYWEHGHCNIGIACGPSDLIVLDLDTPKHPRPAPPGATGDGAQELQRLCQRHAQPCPSGTFTVQTPSGGQHLYFTSGTMRLRNTTQRLGPLIDTRARGGYVLGPGSIISGHPYTITNPASPLPLPPWLAALLTDPAQPSRGPGPAPGRKPGGHASRYALAALRNETQRVASAAAGTRNDTLNRAAFALGQLTAAHLLPARLVRRALTDAALHAGLPASEARTTITSGMTAGTRKPRRIA